MILKKRLINKPKKAFTIQEYSITSVIVGLIFSAVFLGQELITKSKNITAQSITQSSPITHTDNLGIWLETSLEESFGDSNLGDNSAIAVWRNTDYQDNINNSATQNATDSQPVYAKAINNIAALVFDGIDDVISIDGSFLNNRDYTIFILEQRSSNKAHNYFMGDDSITTENETILLGYSQDDQIIHSQGGSNHYHADVADYASFKGPKIYSFLSSSYSGKKTYINGILAAESSDTNPLTNITSLDIGKNYSGAIGEIVIFSRALKGKERRRIENYLAQKWDLLIDRSIPSCTTGTITSRGCSANCAIDITGISKNNVLEGDDTLYCDENGFNPSDFVEYSCSGGHFNVISGSCGCDTGFTAMGSTCFKPCDFTNVVGIDDNTVSAPSGSLYCDQTGFDPFDSITYECNGGVFSQTGGTCDCDTNYALSGSTCVPGCGSATPTYVVLTTGTSYTIPSDQYYCNAKIWAVGGGGGGGGGKSSTCSISGGGGGAGGVAYKTWSAAPNDVISYAIGNAGAQGNGGKGGNGGDTSVTFQSITITGNGGDGGNSGNGSLVYGGGFSGGDGGVAGGNGRGVINGGPSGTGGGAIGGVIGGQNTSGGVPPGGNGAQSVDIDGLFEAVIATGYSTTAPGAGGNGNFGGGRNGKNATGFGCGGGGAGAGGSYGGEGYLGGAGGGGICSGTNINSRGGLGGAGAVVIKLY